MANENNIDDEQFEAYSEPVNSQLSSDIGIDAAGLHGKIQYTGVDRSLSRAMSDYDETSGPGGGSGLSDDVYLGGSTGMADDIGMHIESGFSVGYDEQDAAANEFLDVETATAMQDGEYLTLGDAAQGNFTARTGEDSTTGVQTALGISDVDTDTLKRVGGKEISIEMASGARTGYGAEGTDSDTDVEQGND